MRALIVYAHPEPTSFNASLRACAEETLADQGYEVLVTDLYAQHFKAVVSPTDVTSRENPDVFNPGLEQMHASKNAAFAGDIKAELDKLLAADLLILQFPLWWFSMPAIMKGWVDRVFAFGSAYDFGRTWDDGVFAGKRAMLSVTASAPREAFMPDGRNGDMERVLWPIHAGILALCGYSVLPPFISHGIPFIGSEAMEAEVERFAEVLCQLDESKPMFFHSAEDIEGYRLAEGVKPKTPGQHRGKRWHLPE